MQNMSIWNTWIMILNMKNNIELKCKYVYLKYMNYD